MSSGCLPLLVSLPIVFALYYVVIDPLKYMMGCPTDRRTPLPPLRPRPAPPAVRE